MDFMDNFRSLPSQEIMHSFLLHQSQQKLTKITPFVFNYLKDVFSFVMLKGQIWYCACSCAVIVPRSSGFNGYNPIASKVGFPNTSQLHIICCYKTKTISPSLTKPPPR